MAEIQINRAPKLRGSEKQTEWANSIIETAIKLITPFKIPENAKPEKIVEVQEKFDRFFGEDRAWIWIDRLKHITEQTPRDVIASAIWVGHPKD